MFQRNQSYLLIAGTTDGPSNVKKTDKIRSDGGNYLQGISCDLSNMEKYVYKKMKNKGIFSEDKLFNTLRDMRNLR